MDAAIQKANEKMTFLASDKEMLRLYNMREMAQIDYNSGMLKARTDAVMEVARNLLGMSLPLDQISKATGLTTEELKSLSER